MELYLLRSLLTKNEMPEEKASSMDSHTVTTSSLKVAGCGFAAALYALKQVSQSTPDTCAVVLGKDATFKLGSSS